MKNFKIISLIIVLLLIVIFISTYFPNKGSNSIVIIVEDRLADSLKSSLVTYKEDLEKEGLVVKINNKFDSTSSPSEIRDFLQEAYSENENLQGAVLIGKIPAILFNEKKRQGNPYWHNYLADYYYMDLDGEWIDTDNNGVFDKHSDTSYDLLNKVKETLGFESNIDPEIWVSRLRTDKLFAFGDEIELLKGYFEKNHLYRSGKMKLPEKRAFIVTSAIDVLKSGWGADPRGIYSDLDIAKYDTSNHKLNLADSLRKFLKSDEGYRLGIINVFSGPRIHHFNYFNTGLDTMWWKNEDGEEFIVKYSDEIKNSHDFTWLDVKKIQPNVLFYQLLCSESGRFDYPDYLAGSYVFSGKGLIAIAGTQHSGAVGVPVLYESLASGKSFGNAWKDGLTYISENKDDKSAVFFLGKKVEWSVGGSLEKAVLIGDGTLKLSKYYYSM